MTAPKEIKFHGQVYKRSAMSDSPSSTEMALLTKIAKRHLGLDTLVTRNSDRLDFHDLGTANVVDALHAAFLAGVKSGQSGQ